MTGIETTQYIQILSETAQIPSPASKLKNDMLKIAEMNVAGRKVKVRKATVFMAALSFCAARPISTEVLASDCATMLKESCISFCNLAWLDADRYLRLTSMCSKNSSRFRSYLEARLRLLSASVAPVT